MPSISSLLPIPEIGKTLDAETARLIGQQPAPEPEPEPEPLPQRCAVDTRVSFVGNGKNRD